MKNRNLFTIYLFDFNELSKEKRLTQVKLLSLKSIFKTFPIIEPKFFQDLAYNLQNYAHYSSFKSIKRIIGPDNEDYKIHDWSFIWAIDLEGRMFQFLFQKMVNPNSNKGILVGLAPPELGKLFSRYGAKAIMKTLSLLNQPNRIKFLIVFNPRGKSIVEEAKITSLNKQSVDKLKFFEYLKTLPNVKGQWFPAFEARCPICNSVMTEIKDYKIGFGKLICPRCGYKKMK
ncbi:MAG: hypothetical protein ACTSRH_02980 [Promethearchaeota archaeon]